MGVADKPVAWVATARDAGFELHRVQQGLDPDDWKPMPTIGPGVREIRIHTELEHRVFYVAAFADVVYVLHAFEKRARKTPKRDPDLARDRFRALVRERQAMPSKNGIKVTPSTGNVFRDLGFPAEEAEHLLIRADPLLQLQKAVTARRLTQAALAKVLRITQPRVSDLLRGQLHLFSTDTLIDFLARLGIRVRFVVSPSRRRKVA